MLISPDLIYLPKYYIGRVNMNLNMFDIDNIYKYEIMNVNDYYNNKFYGNIMLMFGYVYT